MQRQFVLHDRTRTDQSSAAVMHCDGPNEWRGLHTRICPERASPALVEAPGFFLEPIAIIDLIFVGAYFLKTMVEEKASRVRIARGKQLSGASFIPNIHVSIADGVDNKEVGAERAVAQRFVAHHRRHHS